MLEKYAEFTLNGVEYIARECLNNKNHFEIVYKNNRDGSKPVMKQVIRDCGIYVTTSSLNNTYNHIMFLIKVLNEIKTKNECIMSFKGKRYEYNYLIKKSKVKTPLVFNGEYLKIEKLEEL